jgi:hypothetical protein
MLLPRSFDIDKEQVQHLIRAGMLRCKLTSLPLQVSAADRSLVGTIYNIPRKKASATTLHFHRRRSRSFRCKTLRTAIATGARVALGEAPQFAWEARTADPWHLNAIPSAPAAFKSPDHLPAAFICLCLIFILILQPQLALPPRCIFAERNRCSPPPPHALPHRRGRKPPLCAAGSAATGR